MKEDRCKTNNTGQWSIDSPLKKNTLNSQMQNLHIVKKKCIL